MGIHRLVQLLHNAANLVEGCGATLAYLACRIIEAHERAISAQASRVAELVGALKAVLSSCGMKPVGGGDGCTYTINPPSGEAWNMALKALGRDGEW